MGEFAIASDKARLPAADKYGASCRTNPRHGVLYHQLGKRVHFNWGAHFNTGIISGDSCKFQECGSDPDFNINFDCLLEHWLAGNRSANITPCE